MLYIIQVKTSSKIYALSKSNKYIKSYQENMIEFWIIYFYFYSFEFRVEIRCSGEPRLIKSCPEVNHVRP